ncbi:RNA-binding domain-containing protein, partial [uncultured Duncaniella sp.]
MTIDLDYIQNLAENHEGVDVEFKETTGQLDRGMETLCGMLNGAGGIIIFGIKNSGKIIGQETGDKTTRMIGEALRRFEPSMEIQPKYVKLIDSDKQLIVFEAEGNNPDRP